MIFYKILLKKRASYIARCNEFQEELRNSRGISFSRESVRDFLRTNDLLRMFLDSKKIFAKIVWHSFTGGGGVLP